MRDRRELYRDPKKGKLAGVCAGVAEYFGIEIWLVRILFVAGFLLVAPPFFFIGYIAAWFILEKKSGAEKKHSVGRRRASKGWRNTNDLDDEKIEVKAKVWQAGKLPKEAMVDIRQKFGRIEKRLRSMETYVTSKEYQLNREISKL